MLGTDCAIGTKSKSFLQLDYTNHSPARLLSSASTLTAYVGPSVDHKILHRLAQCILHPEGFSKGLDERSPVMKRRMLHNTEE